MPLSLFVVLACIGLGITVLDAWRLRRHLARNDAGQCAHCGCGLASWRVRQVRQVRHGAPLSRHGTMIDVCLDCFARYRRRRFLLYGVLPPLVVILLIVLAHRQV